MEENKTSVIFISGNTDMTEKQFMSYYMYQIAELTKDENNHFNISDDEGCSEMVQLLLDKTVKNKDQVTVFCVGNTPKIYVNNEFMLATGFKTLEERNAAMTLASNVDYHVVLSGKGRSGVEDNIIRRNEPEYNYMKHYLSGNVGFWQLFFNNDNIVTEENDETNVDA